MGFLIDFNDVKILRLIIKHALYRYSTDIVRPQTDLTSVLLAEILEPDPGEQSAQSDPANPKVRIRQLLIQWWGQLSWKKKRRGGGVTREVKRGIFANFGPSITWEGGNKNSGFCSL